jgi:hypothetical protein
VLRIIGPPIICPRSCQEGQDEQDDEKAAHCIHSRTIAAMFLERDQFGWKH